MVIVTYLWIPAFAGMTSFTIMELAILILLAAIVLILLWILIQSQKKTADPTLSLMQQEVQSLRGQLAETMLKNQDTVNLQLAQIMQQVNAQLGQVAQQLQKSTGDLNTRLDNAARVVQDVSKGLGCLSEATKQIFEVGKDISSLQEILRSPKLRGGLGELFLGDLLSQIFPPAYFNLQHKFKSGETVDAVIRLGQGLVPVDAKFPLENFKRIMETTAEDERTAARKKFIADVKKHIDAICSKYILPDEGTFDFALMYIPAENVYYELIIRDEAVDTDKALLNYAFTKRVIPVSPNSFYAYLQTILLGLKGMHVEEEAQAILKNLTRLAGDFERFKTEFELVGKHLANTKARYEEADKRLEKFNDRLQSISSTDKCELIEETRKLPL